MPQLTHEQAATPSSMRGDEIGSGCGHMTAIGAVLVGPTGSVLGLEIRSDLVRFGISNIEAFLRSPAVAAAAGLSEDDVRALRAIEIHHRNCFVPDPDARRFDRIHVGASCPVGYLHQLIALLNIGGIAVLPCGASCARRPWGVCQSRSHQPHTRTLPLHLTSSAAPDAGDELIKLTRTSQTRVVREVLARVRDGQR